MSKPSSDFTVVTTCNPSALAEQHDGQTIGFRLERHQSESSQDHHILFFKNYFLFHKNGAHTKSFAENN